MSGMKRSGILPVLMIMITSIMLAGCTFHLEHEWEEATCEKPATCKVGGETKGEPLGHDWEPATCTRPRTCKRCGATEGEAIGHVWLEATCQRARTCTVCGAVEGDPVEHTWIEATCVMPRHCSVCGITEGGYGPHKWVDATYNSPRTCAVCGATEGSALSSYVSNPSTFNYALYVGAKADYHTITGYDNRVADGTVTVVDYKKYPSDAGHPAKEGYEWREVTVRFAMDKPCRVMWGYTDIYTGPSEYARTDYITYADGTKEQVKATQSFNTSIAAPLITPGAQPTPTPTPTPTPEPTPSPTPTPTPTPTQSTTPGVTGEVPSTPITAPQITPSPTPTPTPEPTPIQSEPGKYISDVTQAVCVPIRYDGLIFYVCNADYEIDHYADDSFLFMEMK